MRAGVMVAVVAAAALVGCDEELVCPEGQRDCDGRCAEVAVDARNCGACGVVCGAGEACKAGACTDCASACGAGQTCEGGVCKANLYVACYATDSVVGVDDALAPAGPSRAVDDGPAALTWLGDRLWVANSVPTLLGWTPGLEGSKRHTLGGDYLNAVTAHGGLLYTTSHSSVSLVVVDPEAGVKDEIPLDVAGVEANPRGVAVSAQTGRAVVALAGDSVTPTMGEGQELVVIDVAPSATCTAPPCATVVRRVSLDVPSGQGVVGAYDAPGLPFPSEVAVRGSIAYTTLANMVDYDTPAGNGRLAILDTAAASAAPSFVDLGEACKNPSAITVDGSTVLVGCGYFAANCFPTPGSVIIPVDVSGASPVVGSPIQVPVVPSAIRVCGDSIYAADQCSGAVAVVPRAGGEATSEPVCTGGEFFDFASALACGAVGP